MAPQDIEQTAQLLDAALQDPKVTTSSLDIYVQWLAWAANSPTAPGRAKPLFFTQLVPTTIRTILGRRYSDACVAHVNQFLVTLGEYVIEHLQRDATAVTPQELEALAALTDSSSPFYVFHGHEERVPIQAEVRVRCADGRVRGARVVEQSPPETEIKVRFHEDGSEEWLSKDSDALVAEEDDSAMVRGGGGSGGRPGLTRGALQAVEDKEDADAPWRSELEVGCMCDVRDGRAEAWFQGVVVPRGGGGGGHQDAAGLLRVRVIGGGVVEFDLGRDSRDLVGCASAPSEVQSG